MTCKRMSALKPSNLWATTPFALPLTMVTTYAFTPDHLYDPGNRQEQHWQSYLGELKQANDQGYRLFQSVSGNR